MTRDPFGNPITENDTILFPLGPGNLVPATVEKVDSGLLAPGQEKPAPAIHIKLSLSLPVLNGVVPGIIKIGQS